jgi:hypothetical protein
MQGGQPGIRGGTEARENGFSFLFFFSLGALFAWKAYQHMLTRVCDTRNYNNETGFTVVQLT